MKEKLKKFRELLTEVIASALSFFCLGIIVQLLINDTILGWDPVGNVKMEGVYWYYINCIIVHIVYEKEVIF